MVRLLLAASFLLCLLARSTPVFAQYMYLDTDGDGLSTLADQVSSAGPTTIDVWLRTDHNRDGSQASCVTQDGDLTINSYEFILHASGGTVAWSGFTNHQPDFTISLGHGESSTEYHNGVGGGAILAPGTYRLASITVQVLLGSPSIQIAASTPLSGVFLTSFGSRCSGNDFDNTLKLGSDWFDVDGAPYAGTQNAAPVLTTPADMTVTEGTAAEQELTATDLEGAPITFDLVAGPFYATVTTVDPGTGTGRGSVRLTPSLHDAGVTSATVRASDGLLSDTESFAITVVDVNTAPSLSPIPDLTLNEGQYRDFSVTATDPELDALTFSIASAPGYVVLAPTGAGGVARVTVGPGQADAGEADATIQVTDGVLTDSETFHIVVNEAVPVHNQILCPPTEMLVSPGQTAEQPLHAVSPDGDPVQFLLVSGPPYVTVSTTSSDPANATGVVRAAPGPSDIGAAEVQVAATDGIATDTRAFDLAVGDPATLPDPAKPLFQGAFHAFPTGLTPQSVASGDLDGDGAPDLVTANLSGSVTILRGLGDGRFDRRDDYPLPEEPYSVAIGDLNGDGRPDLAVADSARDVVSLLYAIGACQFGRRRDVGTLLRPAHVKLADWTGDGVLDMVTSDEGADQISVYRGLGDGNFSQPNHYPVGHDPCYSDDGDFNGDGHLDVAVANESSNSVSVLLGNGDGTFRPQALYATGDDPRSVEVGDLNGDGVPDLVVGNFHSHTVSVLLGVGDGTFLGQTSYPCGRAPWSVAIGDLNGDGRLDVVTANVLDHTNSILLGTGGGALGPALPQPAGQFTRFVTLEDVNRDGALDVIAVNEGASTVVVSIGTGDGGFVGPPTIPSEDGPVAVVAGDWNGDGIQDLVVGTRSPDLGTGGMRVHLGTGGGAFAAGQAVPDVIPESFVTGDWNGDGVLDLAFATGDPEGVSVLQGQGDGTFHDRADYGQLGGFTGAIVPIELSGDGHTDLAVMVPFLGLIYQFRNDGTGSFTSTPDTSAVEGAPLTFYGLGNDLIGGDWNGDGRTDLALAQRSPDLIQLFLRTDDGFVRAPSIPMSKTPVALAAGDFDGDQRLDLIAGTSRSFGTFPFPSYESSLEFLPGFGDGTFGGSRAVDAEPEPRAIEGLDANGDGHADLVVSSALSSTVSLLLGLGNGAFVPKRDFGSPSIALAVADLSGDGRADFVTAEFGMDRIAIWLNKGTFPVVPNRAPVADAGGPYAGAVGAPIAFDGTGSSDPDGDPLAMAWSFGDGASATGPEPIHAYQAAGEYSVILTVGDGRASDQDATTATIGAALEARAFTLPEDGAWRLFTGRPSHCIRLEPTDGSFDPDQVDLGSVRLRSEGTGSVEEIGAVAGKMARLLDRDRNGVSELTVCFPVSELRLLFASIAGTADLPVSIRGSLTDGRELRAVLILRVMGAPGFPAAFVAPNPLNPAATLFVATSRAGRLRATLYDTAGRKVRVIADQPAAPAGVHELRFDGRTDQGSELPSGIYFYRVESAEGTTRGRIAVLR